MKVLRPQFLTLVCAVIALGIGFSAPYVCADDLVLKKAATPANVGPRYKPAPDEAHPTRQNTRIGLAPTPYTPEPLEKPRSDAKSPPMGFPDIRELIRKVNKSVVSIRMLEIGSSFPLGRFGSHGEQTGKAMGYGAGFIISSTGHILTNEHVLRNGSQIEVELLDGRKFLAKPLHKDSKNDIALLKIDAKGCTPVLMGNSEAVELGEWVVGIGNPYGIGQSIMFGIVSAQKRSIPGSGYPPLIQIDAAMNLGNSGGPLFNMAGEVVGINTILLWKSQGIGFATPINSAKDFLHKKHYQIVRVQPSPDHGPLGPAWDTPRTASEPFPASSPTTRRLFR